MQIPSSILTDKSITEITSLAFGSSETHADLYIDEIGYTTNSGYNKKIADSDEYLLADFGTRSCLPYFGHRMTNGETHSTWQNRIAGQILLTDYLHLTKNAESSWTNGRVELVLPSGIAVSEIGTLTLRMKSSNNTFYFYLYNVGRNKYQYVDVASCQVTNDGDWKIVKIDFTAFTQQNGGDRWVIGADGTTDEVLSVIGLTTGKTAADEFTIDTVTYTKRA